MSIGNSYSKIFNVLTLAAFALPVFVAGCGGGGGGGGGGNSGPPDFDSPTVSNMTPSEDIFGVGTNSKLTATFSETVVAADVNPTHFRLTDGVNPATGQPNYVSGTVTYDSANRIAMFAPTAGFLPNRRYTATVITGIRDPAGNPLTTDFAWCFTTGTAPDSTAPSVTATLPGNGATAVATNRKLSASFSEEMNSQTLTPVSFRVTGPGNVAVPGAVSYFGRTAVFTPTQVFANNTTYTATIGTGTQDLAGNGAAANVSWTFTSGTTADVTLPLVSSTNPANSQTGVAISSTISVVFSEPMDPTTITTAHLLVTGPGTNPVVGTVSYDSNSNTAIFTRLNHATSPVESHPTPVTDFAPNTTYTVTLTAGVKDMAGNALADNRVWTFTTAP